MAKKMNQIESKKNLVWRRFRKNKLAIVGIVILGLVFLLCGTAPLYIDYSQVIYQDVTRAFVAPCLEHPFGTDQFGRNLYARMLYGGLVSIGSGFAIVTMRFVLGLFFGAIAGYFGGRIDTIIMRIMDVFMSVPAIIMEMVVIVSLGQSILTLYIALTVVFFPAAARLVRATILTVRDQEFVAAANCYGSSTFRIICKHILPNGIGPVVVDAALSLGATILAISGMGFIGLGIPSPTPEWGTILAEGREFIRYYPHLGIIPGLAIGICVMALNFIGDGVRDALDPRTRK